LLVPALLAAALWLLGHRPLAVVVAITTLVLLAVVTSRPAAGRALGRALAAVGRAAATVVSVVLLTLVQAVLVAPVSAVAHLLRRDPLGASNRASGSRWDARAGRVASRRPFGLDRRPAARPGPVPAAAGLAVRVVGGAAVLLALDYGLGWLWDEHVGSHDDPAASTEEAASLADAPAFADDDWADEWWAAFDDLRYEPLPYLLTRVADVAVDGLLTSEGGERASYGAAGPEDPEVWFLGGGALWGEGQRDVHTIPSEVARLAEAAGRPVRVRNLGQPGYTSWQSALLLEQELAAHPAPDLVVVYDGVDDVAVQLEQPADQPTHHNAAGLAAALIGRDDAGEQAEDLWEEYRRTSVLTRLVDGLGGILGAQPAAAADGDLVRRVLDLRARAAALVDGVADRHGVPTLRAWQAATGVEGDGGAYREAAAADQDAIDLSGVLDEVAGAVFADGVVTDEDGARRVAEALWPLVEDALG
jgi:hypothetical protein